jgi:DNA-directed RNA polymerase beta' subunit
MFDGDEMNIHLAQSIQARNELERIANVKYQIIGAKDSNPIIGCVQDSLSGAYMMSLDDNIPYEVVSNLLCNTSSMTKYNIKKGETLTGKQLFSYIIPDGINSIKKKGKDIIFQIKNGELLEGILDKSQLSTKKNSIIHYIWDKYGPTHTQKFIDDTQRLVLNYLLNKGLTIGFKDCIIPDEITKMSIEMIHTKIISANYTLTQYENDSDKINPDIGEGLITMDLNSISSNMGKMIMDSLDKNNGINITITSGSKGTPLNITQIAGCIGQTTVEGLRIKKKIAGRTLPIFHQNDDTPTARGFIKSSYLDGLKGHEFFFHIMGGREGLIDTAIKTALTGYIQRKCIKFLEDLNVNYEGLIRTANGVLVQYLYGDSGIDQQKQTQVKINLINLNNDMIKEHHTFNEDDIKKLEKKYKLSIDKFNKNIYDIMIDMRDKLRTIYFRATSNYKVIDDTFMLPVNLLRITQELTTEEPYMIDPQYIIDSIDKLLTNYDDRFITMMKDNSKLLRQDDISYKFLLRIALYEYLSPKRCLTEYMISKKQFDDVIENIRVLLSRALVEPGEMVGVIAAQSIGEPLSQMSVSYDTKISCILVNKTDNTFNNTTIKIGELCDNIIEDNPNMTYNTGHLNSVETDLSNLDYEYYIIGVDNKEKTHWNKITHISRHPVNGNLMTVTTKSGRTVTTTLSHSHLIRNNQTVEPITGSNLKVGMRIPVAKHIDNTFINKTVNIDNKELTLDYSFGCLVGKHLIDNVPNYAFTAPNEFKIGLIQTYFDIYGEFTYNEIKIKIDNKELKNDLCLLLNYFDIFVIVNDNNLIINNNNLQLYKKYINSLKYIITYNDDIYDDIDMINGLSDIIIKCNKILLLDNSIYEEYINKNTIERNILNKYINIIKNHQNAFLIENELNILNQAVSSNVIWDEIVDIKIYTPDQTDYVYDFTVPGNQTFMVDTGIIVHNTLNTKHFAGVASKSSANSGVPRIKEIMDYSKSIKTPQMIVYFDDKYNTNKADTNMITSYFKQLTIGELIDSAEILYSMDSSDKLSKILIDDKTSNPFYINNQKEPIKTLPFVIRLTLNLEKMMDKETTLLDIKTKFITYWYKHYSNLKTVKKSLKDILINVERLAILSNNNNVIHIRFRLSEYNYNILTSFLNIVLDVITLKGIDNISNVSQVQERRIIFNEKGDMLVDKEHIVITDGINIDGMKMLKGINHARTKINDITTVYMNYGIEAARVVIINELINTFETGGSSVNHTHISLLVDMMTYNGEVISINRHGMNKVDYDPISKASFEKTMDHFINAAIFSETDKMQSVSSRIAIGRVIPGGTGAFDLLLDTEKLKNSEYITNETGGRTSFIPLTKEPIFEDIIKNGFARNDFFIP